MALTVAALADLSFGLKFASDLYRRYAKMDDPADNASFFELLADERQEDASNLDRAASGSELPQGDPTISNETAGPMLGMGNSEPHSAASAAYRVQRAENTLGRMARQLQSLSTDGRLRNALGRVRDHIEERRHEVGAARQRARAAEHGGRRVAFSPIMDAGPAEGRKVVVWFGTNRLRDRRGQFPGERASNVTYGRCHVSVPLDRTAGSLGRGLIGRIVKGDNRVKVQGVEVLGEGRFWSYLTNEVAALDVSDQHGLVFLHGYNTKFNDAARRTAQLKVDLKHKGPAAFFSWPSLGYPAGYAGDEAAIEGSEHEIREFLVDFALRSGARAVHIIAHSMGNRGLLRAMDAIANAAASTVPIRFGQVLLAAPDVDAQLFKRLAVAYSRLSMRATLYVTSNDKAIGLSRQLHHFARVGLTPPIAIVPGIDTIDASRVNLGLLGHGYAAEMRPVLTDMHRLIQSDTAPDDRFGIRKADGGRASYWELI